MGKSFRLWTAALSMAAASQAAPVQAQYMPHLDPNLYILATMGYGGGVSPCMTGTPMADAKIAEARAPSLATMQAYFAAAQGGKPKSAAFHLDKKTKWRDGGPVVGPLDIDRQSDPLAAAGHILEAEPLRFYRGGTGATALGQWAVLGADGQIAGVYTGFFARAKKQWKLRELTLFAAEEMVEPIAQYCVTPGDVMEHRLTSTKNWKDSADKSVKEAEGKHAAAATKRAAAERAVAENPRSSGAAKALRDAKDAERKWAKLLEKRQENRSEAGKKSAEAQRDAADLDRLTGKARDARAFREGADADAAESGGE